MSKTATDSHEGDAGLGFELPSPRAPDGVLPRRVPEGTVPLISVEGTAYECGLWYGESVRQRYPDYIKSLPASRWWNDMSGDAKRLYDRHVPHMFDVHRGLAEGIGATASASASQVQSGCTSFGVSGEVTLDGHPISGQTKDTKYENAHMYIVLRMRIKDAPTILTLAYPGGVSGYGMWSTGMSKFGNSLYSTADSENGLQMEEWAILALSGKSVDEGVELAKRHGIREAGNLLISDAQGESRSVEFNVGGLSVLTPREGILTHGNHPEGPETSPYDAYGDSEGATERENSRYRMHGLWRMIDAERGRLTAQRAMTLMADHTYYPQGICRHWVDGKPEMETTAVVAVEPTRSRLHVTRGQPCCNWPVTYTV